MTLNVPRPIGHFKFLLTPATVPLIFRASKIHPFKLSEVTRYCTVPRQPLTVDMCPDILQSNRRAQKSMIQPRRQPFRLMIKARHRTSKRSTPLSTSLSRRGILQTYLLHFAFPQNLTSSDNLILLFGSVSRQLLTTPFQSSGISLASSSQ